MAEITIARALTDQRLLGAALGDAASWETWVAVLKAAFGMVLDAGELATFAGVAGGRAPPKQRVRELWAIVGRRGGKSRVAALIGVYMATCVRHALAPGEAGMVLLLASTQDQARIVFGYCKAFLEASPVLRKEIVDATRWEIRLLNGITIAVHAGNYRSVRGRTLVGCIFDECGFWRSDDSVAPDVETYTAVLPALLTTNGLLVGISTGYRRAGLLFTKHRDHFGIDSADMLVVSGATTTFNKTISEANIAALRATDPAAGRAEWDGMFRDDIGTFLDDEMIDAAVEHGRPLELPPRKGFDFRMFIDAAGGAAGGDAYACAIAHREGERVILDAIRGVTGRLDPQRVTKEYAALAQAYGIGMVSGDHYAAEWVAASWRDCGVSYQRVEPTGSQIYLETLPLFARGIVRLSNHQVLLRELRLLERRTGRGGRDVVDHPPHCHDDHARAACGALWLALGAQAAPWSPDALLVDGRPAAMPGRAEIIYAVLVTGAREAGVAYFALSRGPVLHLVDVVEEPVSPRLLDGMVPRLVELARMTRARCGAVLYASKNLAAEMERRGCHAEVVDEIIREGAAALALGAAVHVVAGRVKVACGMTAKRNPLDANSGGEDELVAARRPGRNRDRP